TSGRGGFFLNGDERFCRAEDDVGVVSIAVNCSALSTRHIVDELGKREAIRLCQAVLENGILVEGPAQDIIRDLITAAETLSAQLGQRILILLEEISKNRQRHVAKALQIRTNSAERSI